MKVIKKSAITVAIAFTTFFLTACGDQSDFDVRLSNGNVIAIQTDNFSVTNQELFELVAGGLVNHTNPGIMVILDWVDYIILPALVEIDDSLVEQQRETLEALDADELELALVTHGFADIEDVLVANRLRLLREQAVIDSVVFTDEELYEVYNAWFVQSSDDDDEEIQPFEEVRENLEAFLISNRLEIPGYDEFVLANLRADAGMVIYSDYFANHYTDFLNAEFTGDIEVLTGSSDTAIASVNGVQFTIEDFFQTVLIRYTFADESRLFDHINLNMLDAIYNVSRRTINDNITQAKMSSLDWFYPEMEWRGLFTEEAIFNWFWLGHLQTLAINEHITVDGARIQSLQANYTPERATSHILVEDYELAVELIARLQAIPAAEFDAVFAELAIEYSTCPSSEAGGFLGRLTLSGQMVAAFEDATFALAEDQFSQTPVETDFGYHIIYVYDFSPVPSLATIHETELRRLHSTPIYATNLMFTLRAQQNFQFHNEILQSRYNILATVTRQRVENE